MFLTFLILCQDNQSLALIALALFYSYAEFNYSAVQCSALHLTLDSIYCITVQARVTENCARPTVKGQGLCPCTMQTSFSYSGLLKLNYMVYSLLGRPQREGLYRVFFSCPEQL